jgi:minor extracellular serine protease Vpr
LQKKTSKFKPLKVLTSVALMASFMAPLAPVSAKEVVGVKKTVPAGLKNQLVDFSAVTMAQAAYISPGIKTDSSALTTVIVELNQAPVSVQKTEGAKSFSAVSAEKVVVDSQKAFTDSLGSLGIKGNVKNTYKTVLNGVALEIPANKVPLLAKAKNVKSVYESVKFHAAPLPENKPYMNDSGPFVGSNDIWTAGYNGTGIKVGVIDTGIDYNHPDLKEAYVGGWDFVDDDNNPMEAYPDPNGTTEDQIAGSSHGTHVAGTIAANKVGIFGINGVAPKVDLYAYRVLGPDGGTTEDVIAAIEKSVVDGMDVINLSLGNSLNDPNYPSSVAVNNAMLAGTTVVVANGNDGPERWTAGSPATAALGISVGNSTPPGERPLAKASTSLNPNLVYDLQVMSNNPFVENYKAAIEDKDIEIVNAGFGYVSDFEGLDVEGKAVLISRGDIPFVEKLANAKAAGAKVAFIYNNKPGFIEHFLGKDASVTAAFNMKDTDGTALAAAIDAATGPVTINVSDFISQTYAGDELTDSSSRGPVKETYDIKPDFTAPGTSIYSSVPGYGVEAAYETAYASYTGTSMAAPHVAGLSALLLQAHPEWTPFDVKTALSNTATRIGEVGKYTVHDQGAGRVQGLKALQTPILAQVMDVANFGNQSNVPNVTGNINFGTFELGAEGTATKAIQLKDVVGGAESTELTADVEFTLADPGVTVTLSETDFTVTEGGTVQLTATIAVDAEVAESAEYQGYINFRGTDEEVVAHIPFVSYVGEIDQPEGFGEVYQLPEDISPNGDKVLDTTSLYFEVFSQMEEQLLLVWDPIAAAAGFNDGYIGQVLYWAGEDTLPPGFWRLSNYNAVYYDYRSQKAEVLKDGYYTLDWYGWDGTETDGEPSFVVWNDLFIDKQAPVVGVAAEPLSINSDNGKYTYNGTVRDQYVSLKQVGKVEVKYQLLEDGKLLESGDVKLNDNGTFSLPLTKVPSGLSTLKFTTADIAGNKGSFEQVLLADPFYAAITPEQSLAEVGGDYSVSLVAGGIKNIVGAQFEIAYDDTVFTLKNVAASEDFVSVDGDNGVVVVKNEDVGRTTDGKKRVLLGVAFKDQVNGLTSEEAAGILDLTFSVKNDLNVVGNYTIDLSQGGNYSFINKDQKRLFPSLVKNAAVDVVPSLQDITGVIKPEAFVDANGALLSGVDASKIGATVYAVDAKGVVTQGTVNADGTYVIANLSSDRVYSVEVYVPGHFRVVKTDVDLVNVLENGVTVPTDETVDFGTLLAGDVDGDNVIDISDVVKVARYFMTEKGETGWANPEAAKGDFNQDGKVNLLDLSFVVKHFGKKNLSVPAAHLLVAQLKLPNGQTIKDILGN